MDSEEIAGFRAAVRSNLDGPKAAQTIEALILGVLDGDRSETEELGEEVGLLAQELFSPSSLEMWRAYYAGQLHAISLFARLMLSQEID